MSFLDILKVVLFFNHLYKYIGHIVCVHVVITLHMHVYVERSHKSRHRESYIYDDISWSDRKMEFHALTHNK